jgi:hypothetical protein
VCASGYGVCSRFAQESIGHRSDQSQRAGGGEGWLGPDPFLNLAFRIFLLQTFFSPDGKILKAKIKFVSASHEPPPTSLSIHDSQMNQIDDKLAPPNIQTSIPGASRRVLSDMIE